MLKDSSTPGATDGQAFVQAVSTYAKFRPGQFDERPGVSPNHLDLCAGFFNTNPTNGQAFLQGVSTDGKASSTPI